MHRVVFEVVFLSAALAVAAAFGQETRKALNQKEIATRLENGVASSRVQDIARGRAISFPWSSEAERQIRGAGANDELLKALREIALQPPPPAPALAADATMLLEVSPGGALFNRP